MTVTGQTHISAEKIWQSWERAHTSKGSGSFASGSKGFMETKGKRKVPYEVKDVVPGRSFSIQWKALFMRFVFSHEVVSNPFGSEVRYGFQIKGPCAWMVRWLLLPKVKANLGAVLQTFLKQLEGR